MCVSELAVAMSFLEHGVLGMKPPLSLLLPFVKHEVWSLKPLQKSGATAPPTQKELSRRSSKPLGDALEIGAADECCSLVVLSFTSPKPVVIVAVAVVAPFLKPRVWSLEPSVVVAVAVPEARSREPGAGCCFLTPCRPRFRRTAPGMCSAAASAGHRCCWSPSSCRRCPRGCTQ